MDRKEFLEHTILKLDDILFDEMKERLIGKNYISFSFFPTETVTREILAEKLSDYFEKVERTNKNTFDELIKKYMSDIESIVKGRIEKPQEKSKKNSESDSKPNHFRAHIYYENIKNKSDSSLQSITDFSRIMMCLYTKIIENEYNKIRDFEYSINCLDINRIIKSMIKERNNFIKSQKFDLKPPYDTDRCSFIFITIMFYHIKNNEVEGDY